MSRVLPYVWYPFFLAFALAAFFAMLGNSVSPLVSAYAPVAIVGVAIVLLELHFIERDAWRPTMSDVMADTAFMTLVMIALPRLLMLVAVTSLAAYIHANFMSTCWPHEWPLWGQVFVMVLAGAFVRYWVRAAVHPFITPW